MTGSVDRVRVATSHVDATHARRRPGRPSIGSAPASTFAVRLDSDLREALAERAAQDGMPVSEVVRKALRRYLKPRQ